jgi:nitrogen fixation protein NifQ
MPAAALKIEPAALSRQQYHDDLLACAIDSPNARWLAQILASWLVDEGVLPRGLGLCDREFNALMAYYFPGFRLSPITPPGKSLDFSRMLEKQDLEKYLGYFASPPAPERGWVISLIVAACLGSDHLWQDMGLFSRSELSALLIHNFPEMAAKNIKDMKWKKFIYKQLCEAEGLYVCRSPSCEVCKDYQVCFGAEE